MESVATIWVPILGKTSKPSGTMTGLSFFANSLNFPFNLKSTLRPMESSSVASIFKVSALFKPPT